MKVAKVTVDFSNFFYKFIAKIPCYLYRLYLYYIILYKIDRSEIAFYFFLNKICWFCNKHLYKSFNKLCRN